MEKFDNFVCVGDTIEHEDGPYRFVFKVIYDGDCRVDDYDCYSDSQRESWLNDEWYFCGIVVNGYRNGVLLDGQLESLWGIEVNFPKTGNNRHLDDIAVDLLPQAMEMAELIRQQTLRALS